MIMSNEYQSYNLDARPVQLLDLDVYSNLYLKTESGKEYSCTYLEVFCQENNDLNKMEGNGGIKIRRNINSIETPKFDGDIVDIAIFEKPMFETLGYRYYLIASDGSVWYWGWGDNLYDDFFAWIGLGCLGFSIGIALASWITQKKSD